MKSEMWVSFEFEEREGPLSVMWCVVLAGHYCKHWHGTANVFYPRNSLQQRQHEDRSMNRRCSWLLVLQQQLRKKAAGEVRQLGRGKEEGWPDFWPESSSPSNPPPPPPAPTFHASSSAAEPVHTVFEALSFTSASKNHSTWNSIHPSCEVTHVFFFRVTCVVRFSQCLTYYSNGGNVKNVCWNHEIFFYLLLSDKIILHWIVAFTM